jgi:hypothetical protein
MRSRGKSIRRKIVGLLLVPLVSLTSTWAFATVVTSREAIQLLDIAEAVHKIGPPARDIVKTLQEERRQSLVHLADPRPSDGRPRLDRTQRATDAVVGRLRANAAADSVRNQIRSVAATRLNDALNGLVGLESLRRKVEDGTVTRGYAFAAYDALIDPCLDVLNALHDLGDADMNKEGRAIVGLTRARELLAREDALLASALAADHLNTRNQRSFSDLIAGRKLLYSTNLPLLRAEESTLFERYWAGPDTAALHSMEKRVLDDGPDHALDDLNAERWQSTVGTVLDDLDRMGLQAGKRHQERVEPNAIRFLAQAGVAAVLGFAAVLVSLVISVRIGRGLVRDLTRLRRDAHEVSGIRLPSVMRRLASGEQVDIETEAPLLEYSKDEMGQVAQALNTLQRAAVEGAVKQAELRRGISEVFVNLARRSQVLLHRQLTLLDEMERRTEDADELADLFRLDHLTTRMRRHAEGLVILSGAAPARQWRKPVQLMDVVRVAVAEVEDYERIEVRRLPRIAVIGPAVSDLTHLIAELLENATVFSPPHTAVQVFGERVANGFTLEIHDRGLGMTPDALVDANLQLAETPEFELFDTDRLGLLVVSRLAGRQGVSVSLQTSPYGGTTAVVFIPTTLLTEAPARSRRPGGSSDTGEQELPGGKLAALSKIPLSRSAKRRQTPTLDGPVELEAPLSAVDEDEDGLIYRRRTLAATREQAPDSEPAAQPRRSSVLISDHGRPVEGGSRRASADADETGDRPGSPSQTGPGLPRRIRQPSLVPQLKTRPAPGDPRDSRAAERDDRDADEVRARMASLQRGWQRGRAHTGEIPRNHPRPNTRNDI